MEELYKLKQTLCNELEEYSKKEKMSAGDLDVVDKLSHTIKNIDKIIEKYDEDEYSGMGGYSNRMSYTRGGNGYSNERMMDRNYSMARGGRGRGSNARRDSMGRYSNEYNDGYSGHDMIMELRELMEDAPDERTKSEFEKFIRKMEQM
jgi:hypothetical protein